MAAAEMALTSENSTDRHAGAVIPKHFRWERAITLGVFVLSFLYLCLFRRYSWVDPDEGIILQGAQRILDGQVLYRDFFSFFTPGSYYLLAVNFRLFGSSLRTAHTALAFVGAACSPITYVLARRVCSRQASILVTGLMTVTALPLRFVVLHNWDSTLLACLALYSSVRVIETGKSGWAFATGSFAGLTVMFEQSKGAGLVLGLATGFLLLRYLASPLPHGLTRRTIVVLLVGSSLPIAITLSYFASQHALRDLIACWFWPVEHYSAANRVPYGYEQLVTDARDTASDTSWPVLLLKALVFSPPLYLPVLPLLGLALVCRWLMCRNRIELQGSDWSYYVLVSAVVSGLLFSIACVRLDYEHFVYLHPIFLVVLAWLIDGRGIRSKFFVRIGPVVGFCFAISLLMMGAALLFRTKADQSLASRRGTLNTKVNDQIVEYVQAHVGKGERILIYPYDSTYYYLTSTYSPTRYEYFQPGMHTRQQGLEILADLMRNPVPFVLYDPNFADHARMSWPNTPASALAYDPIADYIQGEYHTCRTLTSAVEWRFQFMVRKDIGCPEDRLGHEDPPRLRAARN